MAYIGIYIPDMPRAVQLRVFPHDPSVERRSGMDKLSQTLSDIQIYIQYGKYVKVELHKCLYLQFY